MWSQRIFQVAIPTDDSSKNIIRCLDSVNRCLSNEEWYLVVGDNSSTEDTIRKIKEHLPQLSCKGHFISKFQNLKNSAELKNKVLDLCGIFSDSRPAVLGMDPDDIMLPDRVKLFDYAKEKLLDIVVGPWQYSLNEEELLHGIYKEKTINHCAQDLEFGWWATLFHARIIPGQGKLMQNDIDAHEDFVLWNELTHFNLPFKLSYAPDHIKAVNHHIPRKVPNAAEVYKKVWEKVNDIRLQAKLARESISSHKEVPNLPEALPL